MWFWVDGEVVADIKSGITEIDAFDVLIMHYLRVRPSDDMDLFVEQAAQALWMEERYFKNMGHVLGGKA